MQGGTVGSRRTPSVSASLAALAWIVAPVLWALLAIGPALASAAGKLEVLGGTAPRTVLLATSEATDGSSRGASVLREGQLSLAVRNLEPYPVQLRILYWSSGQNALEIVSAISEPVSLVPAALEERRIARLARRLGRQAPLVLHGSRGAPRDAAGSIAVALDTSLVVPVPGRPPSAVHQLADAVFNSMRGSLSSAQSVTAAAALLAVVCPNKRHCPAPSQVQLKPLLNDLESVARGSANTASLGKDLSSLAVSLRSRGYPEIRGRSVSQITLRFHSSQDALPREPSGIVELNAYTLRAGRSIGRASVVVTSKLMPLGDIRFDPPALVVHTVQWCWSIGCTSHPTATVHLYGAGVGPFLSRLPARAAFGGVLLRQEHGVDVMLSDLKPVPQESDTATGRIELASTPSSGTYAGSIRLSPTLAGAPTLKIEVHSQKWIIWAVLLVFLGVLASGWVFVHRPRARRKRLMRRALSEVSLKLGTQIRELPQSLRDTPLAKDLRKEISVTRPPNGHITRRSIPPTRPMSRTESDGGRVSSVSLHDVVIVALCFAA